MTKHNKKRNIGILYELLLNYISSNLVEGNKREAKKATKIIERHLNKHKELYKEFRLFNAIAQTKASDTHIVASILTEAKHAVRNNINFKKVDLEKSQLIRDINYNLSKDFYYTNIPEYRKLGTIQLAINEWKKSSPDIKKLVEFETKIGQLMLSKKDESKTSQDINLNHSDRLVLKIMTEKFNKKYTGGLSGDQKKIIKNYVFYSDKNSSVLREFFQKKKLEALESLENFEDRSDNKFLLKKVDSVREKINEVSIEQIDDANVIKFLSLTKLIQEIKKGI